MKRNRLLLAGIACLAIAGGAALASELDIGQQALASMRASFKEHGQAGLDRLDQDDVQAACSRLPKDGPLPAALADKLAEAQLSSIRYPADGAMMGDWREGEKIAQSGVGKQYSDDPDKPSGGNCYACHELTRQEVSFGTLGPSLYNFGKLRGQSVDIQRYTYGKIYNAEAYTACSIMPRFGHKAILTEAQIKNLVALLLDPASPVNQ